MSENREVGIGADEREVVEWQDAEYARRRAEGQCVFEFRCQEKALQRMTMCGEHRWALKMVQRAEYKAQVRWNKNRRESGVVRERQIYEWTVNGTQVFRSYAYKAIQDHEFFRIETIDGSKIMIRWSRIDQIHICRAPGVTGV